MSNRTDLSFELLCAMLGDCKAVEVDGDTLCYPEVYTDQVLLDSWMGQKVIHQDDVSEIYIDHETDIIMVVTGGDNPTYAHTRIELLIPVPSTTDLADMLK